MIFMHQPLAAVLTLLFSLGIAWVCICRLNSKASKHRKIVRLRYATFMLGAVSMALHRALWGEWPSTGTAILCGCVLAGLLLDSSFIFKNKQQGQP